MSLDVGTIVVRLAGAVIFGGVIGTEREIHGRPAGLRTHILVSLGSAVFTLVSMRGFLGADPSRVAAQIVSGVGFLGAGTIMHEGLTIRGLTTAASLWVSAAIGLASAVGEWAMVALATGFAFLTLWVLPALERKLNGLNRKESAPVAGEAHDLAADLIAVLEKYDLKLEELETVLPPQGGTSSRDISG